MPDSTDSQARLVQDFTITRVLDATRELVWSALTDPEQLVQFWGPDGTTIPIESVTIEPHEGGAFRATMMFLDGSAVFPMNAVYKEFVEPERMVFETASGITGTIDLIDLGEGKTELRWTTRAAFDEQLLENAKTGTNSSADQLAAHLAAIQA
jgi:uncharacterized protein YndB with AHSA1/START domain